MRFVRTFVVALGLLASLGTAHASTQDTTPIPGGVGGEVPDPAACQVEPRSTDELIALWHAENEAGTPVLATPEARTRTSVPLGEPADATTAPGVSLDVQPHPAWLSQ